ncbi:MAG: glycosyltransferase family 4 protein [Pseudomonadota bacterium]
MSDASLATAVIRAEPDAFDMAKVKLMGRQSAGHGFLRAAVRARGERPIYGFVPRASGAKAFEAIVRDIDPAASFEWIHSDQLNRVQDVGVLYLGDVTVAAHARLRQRAGLAAFSLCGVTHTTASHGAMDEIGALLREAVAPWDALICTSTSVVETVRRVHEAEIDYQRWRFGADVRTSPPQLPMIPLGVHCDDFVFSEADRAAGRAALGLQPDEIVGLFVGRLVFHAKAHPYPMLRAFQAATERTGRRIALIFSGWAPNPDVDEAFRAGAAAFAPDVRVIFVDGREAAMRRRVWAAADLFASPSDNIQETFGLTPVEAMAAGLPVVVSDYDGYRDTVRDQVDGFRIRTWAPGRGAGQAFARAHESGAFTYDVYCWAAAATTAVDVPAFADAVCALVENSDLRKRMGEAGRRRAREVYDWPVVYRQYQQLWSDLNARRRAAIVDPALSAWIDAAPRAAPARQDPFHVFGHYPTEEIGLATRLSLAPGATRSTLKAALDHPLFGALTTPTHVVEAYFAELEAGDITVAEAAARLRTNAPTAARTAGLLLKMGLAGVASSFGR